MAALTTAAAADSGRRDARWPGMQWVYRSETAATGATLSLTQAEVQSGHVAVWVGVDNGERWLQGGIIQTPGAQPYLYAEIGIGLATRPTQAKLLQLGSYRLGSRIRVDLESNSLGRWWVVIDGRRFGSVYLGASVVPRTLAAGEDCFLPGYDNHYAFSLAAAPPPVHTRRSSLDGSRPRPDPAPTRS